MKKASVILQELGFNKDAPDSLKEAFLRHLIKASTGVEVVRVNTGREEKNETNKIEVQLSFPFEESLPSKKAI